MVPSRHYPITDTGDAHLRRSEKNEDNRNAVSSVFQLMNYPPKPAPRKGYFDDKIRLLLNEAWILFRNKRPARILMRSNSLGVDTNVPAMASALMYSAPETGRYSDTNVVLPAPFGPAMITAYFDNGSSTVPLISQMIPSNGEMVGSGLAIHSLDGLAIALTIRSVDGFLSHRDLYRAC